MLLLKKNNVFISNDDAEIHGRLISLAMNEVLSFFRIGLICSSIFIKQVDNSSPVTIFYKFVNVTLLFNLHEA